MRDGATKHVGALLQWVAACGFVALSSAATSAGAAAADDSQILYFEPLQISSPPLSTQRKSTQSKSTQSRELQFDAYGRRFVLALQPNEKLSPLLQSKSGIAPMELYKGQIDGVAKSWVRIAIVEGQLRGMLWDGSDLYVIESVAKLGNSLPTNIAVGSDATAIFRLADVVMTPGATSCGTQTNAPTDQKAGDAYSSLLNELKSTPALMQAAGASRRLQITALGDTLFLNRYDTEAEARSEILLRLNNVDGIFSGQLGVEIQVPSIEIGDALSNTTSASSLLSELGDLRKRSPNLYSRGLTHLFTGRDLDGATVGIAYLDSLCDRQYGAGLTEASNRHWWTESLIAAHEMGHNFGAPHDGEAGKACAGTATGQFLMSPSINGKDDFSACSVQTMQPNIAQASCITALPGADVSVTSTFGVIQHAVGSTFDLNLPVSNVGGLTTVDARAEIALPSSVTVVEAYVLGGSCRSGAGLITCELGAIAGGNSTEISLVLRSDVTGANLVTLEVSATNDTQTDNNTGEGTLRIAPEADVSVGLQAPASASAGTAFDVTLTATNLSAVDTRDLTVTVELPNGVTASSATLAGIGCTVQSNSITCSLSSLRGGASVTGTASLVASTGGSTLIQARIAGSYVDPIAGNDTASATVGVVASAATTSQSTLKSSGGGGCANLLFLSALLGLLGLKKLRTRVECG
jgi:hypothetical protein